MVCEFFYKSRYIDEEHELIHGRELMAERFENTLKKVAAFFFYKKQADSVPSYNALLNRWEKLWFPKDMTAYDLAVEQHETTHGNIASYSNIAAASLEFFHNKFKDDPYMPVAIDEEFIVPLGRGVKLEGSFDLVLKRGDSYKVIKWYGRRQKPKTDSVLLDFAALRYAFEYRAEYERTADFLLYNLTASHGSGFIKIDYPQKADMEALRYWAKEIEQSETFVPRRGFTAYCRGCPFDEQCLNFTNWPTEMETA